MARVKPEATATRVAVRGMQVTITLAEQRYSPVSFNTFGVGPFTATVTIAPGDDVEQVLGEAREILREAAKVEFKRAIESYTKALDYNDRYVKAAMAERRGESNGS